VVKEALSKSEKGCVSNHSQGSIRRWGDGVIFMGIKTVPFETKHQEDPPRVRARLSSFEGMVWKKLSLVFPGGTPPNDHCYVTVWGVGFMPVYWEMGSWLKGFNFLQYPEPKKNQIAMRKQTVHQSFNPPRSRSKRLSTRCKGIVPWHEKSTRNGSLGVFILRRNKRLVKPATQLSYAQKPTHTFKP